jgi:phospholipid/cholesterol/gamma-HCH transport system substrate-binding protein
MFPSTISLYNGANVDVLGVTVGRVTGIQVIGNQVKVTMTYDADRPLPAGVKAVIVPPSIVGDRYVELRPAYTGGAKLADDATVPEPSTAVPVEVDQVYASLNQLAAALGPSGANSNGALSDLLTVLASNLKGNGSALHSSIHDLSEAVATLGDNRGNLASSVTNLSQISQTLASDDPQVRTLAQLLARVSGQLNAQDGDLSHATKSLNIAFRQVAHFVAHNRTEVTSNIKDLTAVSKTLSAHRQDVAATLDLAPLALTDLWESYAPENWDIAHPTTTNINGMETATTARGNLLEDLGDQLGSTLSAVCAALPTSARKQISALCTALATAPQGLNGLLGQLASASPSANPNAKPSDINGLLLGGLG